MMRMMKRYEKPMIKIEDLLADADIADTSFLGEIDPLGSSDPEGPELSVPIGDGWDQYL